MSAVAAADLGRKSEPAAQTPPRRVQPAQWQVQSRVGGRSWGRLCPAQGPQEAKSPLWVMGPLKCGHQEGRASLRVLGLPCAHPVPSCLRGTLPPACHPPPTLWGQHHAALPMGEDAGPLPLLVKPAPLEGHLGHFAVASPSHGEAPLLPWHLVPARRTQKPTLPSAVFWPKARPRQLCVSPHGGGNSSVTHALSQSTPASTGAAMPGPGLP